MRKLVRFTPTDSFHKERLMRFVQRGASEDDCWSWTGAEKRHGYGRVRINKVEFIASRLSWAVHNGRDPGRLDVCHDCDNPPCCNPKHLFLGTMSENIKDAADKGKIMGWRNGHCPNKGEQNPMAKLTREKADKIRALYRAGGISYSDLGRRYGVLPGTIGKIVKRERWA